jgi:peptidyl-prolyl cis-trans isomerase SurA
MNKSPFLFFTSLFLLFFTFSLNAQQYRNGLIDKTIALIGGEIILLSQLESEVQMMQVQGYASDKNLRCEVLENMMVSKLFLTQARLDSLKVNNDMVASTLEDRMNNVMTQLGGREATEEYFGKNMFKLRQEWKEILTEQSLTQDMQRNVMSSATNMTPDQIEKFYKTIPKDSLPIISTQYRISQIVVYPDKEAAEIIIKEKLLYFRERVLKGEKFSFLARMYSQDPGTVAKGGELGMSSKNIFLPAFSDAAMSLKEGQVSPIVETDYGFHIIQMIEKKGDMFNARHILLKPEYTDEDKKKAFKSLDSLKFLITSDSLSFETVARFNSQDFKSRTNGGLVSDPNTGSTYFEKDQLNPSDYLVLKDMKEGDISAPFQSTDNEGRGNTIYKILKLEKIIPSHVATFKDDFSVLQNIANNKKQMDAIDNFVKEKQAITYIVVDPLFHKCPFDREGWLK